MAQITRADAAGLLQEQEINELIGEAQRQSVAMQTFRTVRMSSKQARMPVLSALPTAGWVTDTGDSSTDTKPTTSAKWESRELIAEELAAIVPVHENVLDDSNFDIWAQIRPSLASAVASAIDSAVLFGTNKPATWTAPALLPGATSANNTVDESGYSDLAESVNAAWSLVEEDDFDVNTQYAPRRLRSRLRGLRTSDGEPIYLDSIRGDGQTNLLYGEPILWVTNGSWPEPSTTTGDANATMLVGDASSVVLGIRQDMQMKMLDQATVGGINLAERDMVALRVVMRVAYTTAVTVSRDSASVDRFPFAAVLNTVA